MIYDGYIGPELVAAVPVGGLLLVLCRSSEGPLKVLWKSLDVLWRSSGGEPSGASLRGPEGPLEVQNHTEVESVIIESIR